MFRSQTLPPPKAALERALWYERWGAFIIHGGLGGAAETDRARDLIARRTTSVLLLLT